MGETCREIKEGICDHPIILIIILLIFLSFISLEFWSPLKYTENDFSKIEKNQKDEIGRDDCSENKKKQKKEEGSRILEIIPYLPGLPGHPIGH